MRENVYDAINSAYADNLTDEFIPATVINGYRGLKEGDGVFCLNFRSDRAREILSAIGDPNFDSFEIGRRPKLSIFSFFFIIIPDAPITI